METKPIRFVEPKTEVVTVTPTAGNAPQGADVVDLYLSVDTETGEATVEELPQYQQTCWSQREHDGRDFRVYLPPVVVVARLRDALAGLTVDDLAGPEVDWSERTDLSGGLEAWHAATWLYSGFSAEAAVRAELGITPATSDADLGRIAAELIADAGINHIVLLADQVRAELEAMREEERKETRR